MNSRLLKFIYKVLFPKKFFDEIYFETFINDIQLKNLKFGQKIWSFKHGFLPLEYVWYNLSKNDYRNYLPARNSIQKRSLNGSYNAILANKILFCRHLKRVIEGIDHLNVVESIGFFENGYLQSLHSEVIQGEVDSLLPLIEKTGIILKPILGDGGEGLLLVENQDGNFLFNKNKSNWDELVGIFGKLDGYLIQVKITQRGFSNDIYGGSVNTMRIATMVDPVNHKPFIAYAAHRFGSSRSRFLDNVSQGGITALIDIETGKLSKGMTFSSKGEKEVYEAHPISLSIIFNRQIPNWKHISHTLLKTVSRMPYFKYVGWDLIVSDDEIYLLEGNVAPGLGMIQMFKSMKEFPSAWDFFKHHKFI